MDRDAAADVVGETDFQGWIALMKSHGHDITKGGFVYLHSLMVGDREELDVAIIIDFVCQFPETMVDFGADVFFFIRIVFWDEVFE